MCAKACKWSQALKYLQSWNKTSNAEECHEDTQKRASMRSKGRHPCHSDKMQPKEESFGETRRKKGSTYAGASSDHRIPGKARFEHIIRLWPLKKIYPTYARKKTAAQNQPATLESSWCCTSTKSKWNNRVNFSGDCPKSLHLTPSYFQKRDSSGQYIGWHGKTRPLQIKYGG